MAVGNSILSIIPVEEAPEKNVLSVLQDTVDYLQQGIRGVQPYDLKVYIAPIKKFNVLALPGGAIVVFEGLLTKAESFEELAGVLAHEIQHILLRYSTRGIVMNASKIFLTSLLIGDVNLMMERVVDIAGDFETLGLSREMEAQADRKGMELILASNINPNGMIQIFKKLERETVEKEDSLKTDTKKFFSYFLTHPAGLDRVACLNKMIGSNKDKNWKPLFPELDWNEIKP